jgi:hypothetical protein
VITLTSGIIGLPSKTYLVIDPSGNVTVYDASANPATPIATGTITAGGVIAVTTNSSYSGGANVKITFTPVGSLVHGSGNALNVGVGSANAVQSSATVSC